MTLHQWDIIKIRIRPEDQREHYAVVFSPDRHCADERRTHLNVIYCSTNRPAESIASHEVFLDASDGVDWGTVANCSLLHVVPRTKINFVGGRVAAPRRRQICRKLGDVFQMMF